MTPVAVPDRGKVPEAVPVIGAVAVAVPVSGSVPLAIPELATVPVAAPVRARTPLALTAMITVPVAAPVKLIVPAAVPVIPPPPPPPVVPMAGTRMRSMSVSDQGRAVAVGMAGGKVGLKAPLPRKVSFNGSAIPQGWRKKRNHHLCDFSSPTTVIFVSVSPYPHKCPTGTRCLIVPPQKWRLDRGQRSCNRIIAIQKNLTRPKPLVGRFCKKKVIIPGVVE
jgi:hypothetical protein